MTSKGINGCAEEGGKGKCKNRMAVYLGLAEIGEKQRRLLRAPAENLAGLVALFGKGVEGKWRGGRGQFIGAERARNGQGVKRI
jgi:hypothetical protein